MEPLATDGAARMEGGVSFVGKSHLGPLIIRGLNVSHCLTAAPPHCENI